MPEFSVGTCPLCRAEMYQKDRLVICPEKDYKAKFESWDERWNRFDPLKDSDEEMVSDLVALNLIEVE